MKKFSYCILLVVLILFLYIMFKNGESNVTTQDDISSNTNAISSIPITATPTLAIVQGKDNNLLITPSVSPTTTADEIISDSEETFTQSVYTRESLRELKAGAIVDINSLLQEDYKELCFYADEIGEEIKSRINGKSYKSDCTIPYSDLRYIRLLYYGFDQNTHIGELIVNKSIADDIIDIFLELYDNKYPIEQMVLVDEYNADDDASMSANNTSAFNYRTVSGSATLSKHALGLAIDINPLYNPFVQYKKSGTVISPVNGEEYADRSLPNPYYIKEGDTCYNAFINRGFLWGGSWKTQVDYQHFQKDIRYD